MRERKFNDRGVQKAYDNYRFDPPELGSKGTDLHEAYNLGYGHPELKSRYQPTSVAFGAWAAGIDNIRDDKAGN